MKTNEVLETIKARRSVPENHKVYGCAALGYADPNVSMKEKSVKAGTITICV